MAEPQSYKNHTRFDPLFHFFLAPVALLNVIATCVWYARHFAEHTRSGAWLILISIFLLMLVLKTRLYALHNQDRTIRLEERLRYALLLPTAELPLVQNLSMSQTVALRFASDAELPVLALRAVSENLAPKQIKESIGSWRADNFRI